MKRYYLCLVLVLLLSNIGSATVGIGLKWFSEGEIVKENSQTCLNYGLYNPFDQDVMGFLEATKDLGNLSVVEEPKLIPAGTSSINSIMTKICFNVPDVYKEDCILWLCERKCEENQKVYSGEVVAAYQLKPVGGTGSATGSSFAAPLTLSIKCEPLERNLIPLYIFIIIMGCVVIYILKRRKLKHAKVIRKKK